MKCRSVCCVLLVLILHAIPGPPLASALDSDRKLVGTVVAADPEQSLAVIENPTTGRQRVYREGDQLGDGFVKKILFGKVIVETGAGEEVLAMGGGSSSPSPRQTARLDRETVDSAIPDYTQMMRQIRVRPKFEGGQPSGFVIYNIGAGSIFEQMGLKDGDVIVAVNGRTFDTTQPVVEFYDALMEDETVSLEVKRGDSTQRLLLEIQ